MRKEKGKKVELERGDEMMELCCFDLGMNFLDIESFFFSPSLFGLSPVFCPVGKKILTVELI